MTKPYEKIYHRGHLVNADGGVSPLCATTPRPINLKRALWTNRDEAVTCPRCLKKMAAQFGASPGASPAPQLKEKKEDQELARGDTMERSDRFQSSAKTSEGDE